MRKIFILITIILLGEFSYGATLHKEKDYQNVWCKANNGKTEVILTDKARVDCVTDTHAIEFDFAKKWGESIGQALYYGLALNKQPGIVLIMENGAQDTKYLTRVKQVAMKHNIKVWTMTPEDISAYSKISAANK